MRSLEKDSMVDLTVRYERMRERYEKGEIGLRAYQAWVKYFANNKGAIEIFKHYGDLEALFYLAWFGEKLKTTALEILSGIAKGELLEAVEDRKNELEARINKEAA